MSTKELLIAIKAKAKAQLETQSIRLAVFKIVLETLTELKGKKLSIKVCNKFASKWIDQMLIDDQRPAMAFLDRTGAVPRLVIKYFATKRSNERDEERIVLGDTVVAADLPALRKQVARMELVNTYLACVIRGECDVDIRQYMQALMTLKANLADARLLGADMSCLDLSDLHKHFDLPESLSSIHS